MKTSDIVVIGAGIAGLTSAVYLKRANAKFVILEGSLPGGTLSILKDVENYPGFKKCSGKDILLSLMEQIHELNIEISYGNVQTILKEPEGFKIHTDKDSYLAKAVIIASGLVREGDLLKGEKEYLGRGVSYCATCDGNFFKNDDVVVYGSGSTSVEAAIYLANLVKNCYFVSSEEIEDKFINELKKYPNIKIINKTIKEIKGDMFGVTGVVFENDEELNVHGVFPFVGSKSSSDFLTNLKPTMMGNFLKTDDDMQTDIEGLFAIGDVRYKSLRQLVTAASDGAIAAISANKFVKNK